MNNLPDAIEMIKAIMLDAEAVVTAVGYSDFAFMKPQRSEWVQGHYTLHFVISGSGYLKMGGKVHEIGAGQIFIIPPNEPMMYYPDCEDTWKYIWFTLSARRAGKMLAETGATRDEPVITPEDSGQTASLMMKVFLNGNFADDYRVISVFYELMHRISHQESEKTDNIKSLIDANYADAEFSIAKLCRACGLSHAQLCRVFSEKFGITAKRYLIDKRMEYAKELLRSTELKLATVALSSGYSDPTHFMKEFKRHNGVTAGVYRAEHRER